MKPKTKQPPIQNFYQQEIPMESLIWVDGAKSIQLSSFSTNIKELTKIAEKFIPINKKIKGKPPYTD